MASLTIVLQSQHSVITAIICNWHLWQGEPSPSDEWDLCVSMLRNTRKLLGHPPSPHMWTVWHSSDLGSFFSFLFLELWQTPQSRTSSGKCKTKQACYGIWQRFVLVRVMAGLELHEPVDLQAKTKHDSRALDAASAGGETVSTLQQIQKIQSGPKTSETLRQKKQTSWRRLITPSKEVSTCRSVQVNSFDNVLDSLPSSHTNGWWNRLDFCVHHAIHWPQRWDRRLWKADGSEALPQRGLPGNCCYATIETPPPIKVQRVAGWGWTAPRRSKHLRGTVLSNHAARRKAETRTLTLPLCPAQVSAGRGTGWCIALITAGVADAAERAGTSRRSEITGNERTQPEWPRTPQSRIARKT